VIGTRLFTLQQLALWALENPAAELDVRYLPYDGKMSGRAPLALCGVPPRGRTVYLVWDDSSAYSLLRQLQDPLACLALATIVGP